MSSGSGSAAAGVSPGAASSPLARLLRLSAVPGYEQHRINDVLLLRPEPRETQATRNEHAHVVFFPGDIQVRLSLWLEYRKLSWSLDSHCVSEQLYGHQRPDAKIFTYLIILVHDYILQLGHNSVRQPVCFSQKNHSHIS